MASFSFNTAAELFPPRSGKRSARVSPIGDLAPRPSGSLRDRGIAGGFAERRLLQVDEARFDQSGIRTLYESQDFSAAAPPRAPEPEPSDKADTEAA